MGVRCGCDREGGWVGWLGQLAAGAVQEGELSVLLRIEPKCAEGGRIEKGE